MNYDWAVVLNNQPVTELLVSPANGTSKQEMEQIARDVANGKNLEGSLFAWQFGRADSKLYSNLRQGQYVCIPSESVLFITVMERKKDPK